MIRGKKGKKGEKRERRKKITIKNILPFMEIIFIFVAFN